MATSKKNEQSILGEEQAVAKAQAERVTIDEGGPVLHVPATQEEAVEVAGREATAATAFAGQDREQPAADAPAWRRVVRFDGPINLNERAGFDPDQPDITTTDAGIASVEAK